MLTPIFELEQSEECVIMKIHAPYTKVSDVEITIEDTSFSFYAKPYLLRLEFPDKLQEEDSSCTYDVDDGKYIVLAKKVNRGKHFHDLDLLTTLIMTKKSCSKTPSIEVISNVEKLDSVTHAHDAVDMKWDDIDRNTTSLSQFGYGFANQKRGIISKLQEDVSDIVYVISPDDTSYEERFSLREKAEEHKFDSDYYLADLYENERIEELVKYKPWWTRKSSLSIPFTTEENILLQKLPNRDYIMNDQERQLAYLGLLDILYAYAYDVIVNEGEDNVESSWNVRTISCTLSWCDTCINVWDALATCFRRSLCYPQHRNWKLANKVMNDVIKILEAGRRCVLRCLIQILIIFREADGSPCYVLNDLYINDYCVWIQKVADIDITLKSLAKKLAETKISKKDLGLEIDILEEAAELVFKETDNCEHGANQPSEDNLIDEIEVLSINS